MASSAEPGPLRRARAFKGVLWTALLLVLILGLLRLKPLATIAPAFRAALFVLGPIGLLALLALIGLSLWRRTHRTRNIGR